MDVSTIQEEAKTSKILESSLLRSSSFHEAETSAFANQTSRQLTALEDRELRRVFNNMCNYYECYSIDNEIMRLEMDEQAQTHKIEELRQLRQQKKHLHLITVNDVVEISKNLNGKLTLAEAQDMIWEVDENLDEAIDWDEFLIMYQRNMSDATGIEPGKLFHLTQFLMFDSNGNGKVSVDETMNMIYMRYGKEQMEVKLKELFGEDMMETGKEGGEIDLRHFLDAVERVQLSTFFSSPSGKRLQRHRKEILSSAVLRPKR